MAERYIIPAGEEHRQRHFYTYILMVYFLLAPFEDVLTFSLGTLGKWLAVLVVIAGLYETRGRIKLRFKEGNLCLMWLMLLGVLSCLWAIDLKTALDRNVAYLTLPGFFLFVSAIDFSQNEYEGITRAAVLGGVAVSIYILLNGYTVGAGRVSLNENNDPNNMAALLQLPMAMAFRQAMKKDTRPRMFYIAAVVLLVVVLLLTGSRGGMVSMVVFFLSYLLLSKAYKKLGALFGVLVVTFLFWRFVLPALPENISNRLFETDYSGELLSGNRVRIWRTVFYGLVPRMPAYGVGAGCAPQALLEWLTNIKGVHNTYFNMICEYGVLGIGVFLCFLFEKVRTQIRLQCHTEAALMLCIYVTIFFLDAYAVKFFWNVMILTTIAANVNGRENFDPLTKEER